MILEKIVSRSVGLLKKLVLENFRAYTFLFGFQDLYSLDQEYLVEFESFNLSAWIAKW